MNYVVFDIETTDAVGPGEITDMDISVVSVYDSKNDSIQTFTVGEFNLMWKLFESAEFIVGYNSNHFDIPILNKYYSGDLTVIKSIDLLESIKQSFGRRVKLDDIAKATLGIKKSGHGLQAVEWWKEGKIDKIKKYCEDDVRITHEVFLYARDNGHLKLKGLNGKVINIPINTESWNDKLETGVTFSMGF